MVRRIASLLLLASLTGCGYTTKTNLPDTVRSVHVAPVTNAIDLSAEVSDKDAFKVYRPGLEVDLTNAIINRFIFDGNLRVEKPDSADSTLQAKLIEYRRDPLRYSDDDDVQEYRLNAVIEVALVENGTGKAIWKEDRLIGDTTYYLSGPRAESEDQAVGRLVEDVARRVVEKTVEIW
jgi:predicted small lipoprotein YifL